MKKGIPALLWSKHNLIGLLLVVTGGLLVMLVMAALILPASVWAAGDTNSFIPLFWQVGLRAQQHPHRAKHR